jgi:hypothetical protein
VIYYVDYVGDHLRIGSSQPHACQRAGAALNNGTDFAASDGEPALARPLWHPWSSPLRNEVLPYCLHVHVLTETCLCGCGLL